MDTLDERLRLGGKSVELADCEKSDVLAIEVEWLAANAFDEPLARQTSSFARKNPARLNQAWTESESGYRLAEDVSKLVVKVTRVKFSDGTIWTAPALEPALAEPSPTREEHQ